jgi:hypothetical protein
MGLHKNKAPVFRIFGCACIPFPALTGTTPSGAGKNAFVSLIRMPERGAMISAGGHGNLRIGIRRHVGGWGESWPRRMGHFGFSKLWPAWRIRKYAGKRNFITVWRVFWHGSNCVWAVPHCGIIWHLN